MKKIECYIQPYNLDTVAEALAVEGVVGMSVAEVKGFGVQKGFTRGEAVKPGEFRFHPKMKVEMVVLANEADAVMERLESALTSSGLGPAKMFCWPVDAAVHTRSGTRDHQALAWRFVAGK